LQRFLFALEATERSPPVFDSRACWASLPRPPGRRSSRSERRRGARRGRVFASPPDAL